MRIYATDSPQAVCRLLALAMIVDGHLAPSELEAMHASRILRHVQIDEDGFDDVVRGLCEDLLATAHQRGSGEVEIDVKLLDALLADVASPQLRMSTMKAMLDIVHADTLVDERETLLIQRAFRAWGEPYRPSAGKLATL
ncbi:TerB family tellurite resistance protein [uncultured Massilia sp.]|uniref:tellurite resistance TerB family protein n=1 Tax=uncultured Massilia sp. TaxID=169973 RepID=UPI0025F483D5|nr:TerB family tellurite resistance protein [uncultured Massilia sp.]